ncbi:unnamed protein product [Closterium sp. NIES-64]|nr:unnamed protein product [Closterium sp. NIES-64]CAI5995736.1 unnamed protein product [Closterium sp. NIES-65]
METGDPTPLNDVPCQEPEEWADGDARTRMEERAEAADVDGMTENVALIDESMADAYLDDLDDASDDVGDDGDSDLSADDVGDADDVGEEAGDIEGGRGAVEDGGEPMERRGGTAEEEKEEAAAEEQEEEEDDEEEEGEELDEAQRGRVADDDEMSVHSEEEGEEGKEAGAEEGEGEGVGAREGDGEARCQRDGGTGGDGDERPRGVTARTGGGVADGGRREAGGEEAEVAGEGKREAETGGRVTGEEQKAKESGEQSEAAGAKGGTERGKVSVAAEARGTAGARADGETQEAREGGAAGGMPSPHHARIAQGMAPSAKGAPVTAAEEPPELPSSGEAAVAAAEMPVAYVKRMMRLDGEVRQVSSDAAQLVASAAHLFLESLAASAFSRTRSARRLTITQADVAAVVRSSDKISEFIGSSISCLRHVSSGPARADTARGRGSAAGVEGSRKRVRAEAAAPAAVRDRKARFITAFFLKS